jgi:5-methyltetrahydrofolate--homocysteine methyltransferase
MLQALSDRLAEAFAEWAHAKMRKESWGYAPEEDLSIDELLKCKYQGIRPAPGYPSQPDHTEKWTMWELLKCKEVAGIELTESLAMLPASSVSALCFACECWEEGAGGAAEALWRAHPPPKEGPPHSLASLTPLSPPLCSP